MSRVHLASDLYNGEELSEQRVACGKQKYVPVVELVTTIDEGAVTCDDCLDVIDEADREFIEDARYEPRFEEEA